MGCRRYARHHERVGAARVGGGLPHQIRQHALDRCAPCRTRGVLAEQGVDPLGRIHLRLGQHLVDRLSHQLVDEGAFRHLERRVDAQLERMRPQDARAHAVYGGNPGLVDLERLAD